MSKNILFLENARVFNTLEYQNIAIPEKRITFISGNSGCGKSTLLRIFNGTLEIDHGLVSYCGKNILEYDSLDLRRQVLLVNQSPFFFEGSIYDNFLEYYSYRDQTCPDESEIKKYLDLCKIPIPLTSICDDLSGGEKQRVFTGLFLSFKPRVLMLDEPTSALDSKTAIHFMDSITSYCMSKDITLIIISHDTQLTEKYANHIINLDELCEQCGLHEQDGLCEQHELHEQGEK